VPGFPVLTPMDYTSERKIIFEKLQSGFLQVPTIWFVLLMRDEGACCADGQGRYKAVSPSFWKFLLVLWQELMWPRKSKKSLSASLSLRQFGIRPKDACLWANAVVAGGLFTVEKGDFTNRRASTYIYNTEAGFIEWQGFYRGLMMASAEWRVSRASMRGVHAESIKAWAALVSLRVRQETALLCRELGVRRDQEAA